MRDERGDLSIGWTLCKRRQSSLSDERTGCACVSTKRVNCIATRTVSPLYRHTDKSLVRREPERLLRVDPRVQEVALRRQRPNIILQLTLNRCGH